MWLAPCHVLPCETKDASAVKRTDQVLKSPTPGTGFLRRCHILKTQLRCDRSCDFKTQLRFQDAAAIWKSHLRSEGRRCGFENASAAWTSQVRFSYRRCEIDIEAAERSRNLTSAGISGLTYSNHAEKIILFWPLQCGFCNTRIDLKCRSSPSDHPKTEH